MANSGGPPPARVVVIHDHTMMLEGLMLGLDRHEGIEIAGSCRSVSDVTKLFDDWRADVIVTDYQLPDGTGLDVVKFVRSRAAETKVIVLSGIERVGLLHDVIAAGGDGLVSTSDPLAELVNAVLTVHTGASAFPLGALRQWARRDLTELGATLTPREREVLALLAEAMSAKSIAGELHVSSNTARNHIRSILNKLGVNSQLEAVVAAQRAGLV